MVVYVIRLNMIKAAGFSSNLYIYYLSKSPNSYIELLKDQVFFDKT